MSSAFHSPHSQQAKQQWWSRPGASKIPSSSSLRSTSSPVTPTTPSSASPSSSMFDDKSLPRSRTSSTKQFKKFNTLATVMGLKPKKDHPTIDIPPGPVSPPLPFQNPPAPATAPPVENPSQSSLDSKRLGRASRPVTSSSYASSQTDPRSPGEPSIYTYPSSEEAYEPITPSDQLSRHRTSYQPSLFTFASQQEQSAVQHFKNGSIGSRYLPVDSRRISVMSDPSILDPQLPKETGIRAQRTSGSYYMGDPKGLPSRLLEHRYSQEQRKCSGESRQSKELDVSQTLDVDDIPRLGSTELRVRDSRYSDTNIPSVPKFSSAFALNPSQLPRASVSPGHSARSISGASTGLREEEYSARHRVPSMRNSGAYDGNDLSPPSSARISPGSQTQIAATGLKALRLKASSVSAGSPNASNASNGGRPSPTVITSFSSTSLARTTSGSSTSVQGGLIRRQTSSSRLRPVPPSRTPPPLSNLPPTPSEHTPSPMTFRSPTSALEEEDFLISPMSANDDPSSILNMEPPPETPMSSSSSSSASVLYFAQPYKEDEDMFDDDLEFESFAPMQGLKQKFNGSIQSPPSSLRGKLRDEFGNSRSSQYTHTAKSSVSSNMTLMSALGMRNETPVQRTLKKSMSQSSLQALTNAVRNERSRVDSEASIGSANDLSEESGGPILNSMRSLRKQRSMHNTRVANGSLAMPPLPQQLRHANSFNTASATDSSGSASKHGKDDSTCSPVGKQRRKDQIVSPNTMTTAISVGTPMHKKRSLFSHGRERERRDSDVHHDKDRRHDGSNSWVATDNDRERGERERKKSSGLGLSMFSVSGHFSQSLAQVASSSSAITGSSKRVSVPAFEDHFHHQQQQSSPTSTQPMQSPPELTLSLDQHILPPKELLSQMERLADTEAPHPPARFSLEHGMESETDEDCWDSVSYTTDKQSSNRSRVTSTSGLSFADSDYGVGLDFETSSQKTNGPSGSGKHYFLNANTSITERLDTESPQRRPSTSTSHLLQPRKLSITSRRSNTRPSTADAYSSLGLNAEAPFERPTSALYQAVTALPPPPRRKGAAVSIKSRDSQYENDGNEASINHVLTTPPPKHNSSSSRLHRLASFESGRSGKSIQREPSRESLTSTYNPNRGSIFRKPSFLNIGDDFAESQHTSRSPMPTVSSMALSPSMISVPEDSFLILESGKDSLDLMRSSIDLPDNFL